MIKLWKDINFKIEMSDDRKISIALLSTIVVLSIQYFVLVIFHLLNSSVLSRIQLMSKAVVGIMFLYALPVVIKKSKLKLIVVYSISILIFIIHFILFPQNQMYIRELIFPFFFTCLPAFVYSMTLDNLDVLKQTMKKACFIIFLCGTTLGILVFSRKLSIGYYSMSLSYYMLFPAIIYMDELFDKLSIKVVLLELVSLSIILVLGSRGPLLCIIMFVLLKLIRLKLKISYKWLPLYLLGIASMVLLFLYRHPILEMINNFLLSFKIESRTISLFLSEGVFLTGRDKIYENVITAIINNPYLGIGLAGDRIVSGAVYSHNILLEIVSDFGIVLGVIIVVALIILILKALITKDKEKYNMFIIWASLGFVHLMVSNSYLIDFRFWIFLGLIINKALVLNKKN